MNLKDLRYLVAIDDHKHFGKAADACFISQPTLSAQLKKLEQYLGVVLVERTPRNIRITPIGSEIVARARKILADSDALVKLAKTSHDPFAGTLSVGFIPTVGPYLLPHIVSPIAKALPNLKTELVEAKTADLLAMLNNGKLDCAVLAAPLDVNGLEELSLYREGFLLAERNEAGAAKEPVTLASLKLAPMLLLAEGHCLRDQTLNICEQVGAGVSAEFQATSLETLRHMVAMGQGKTLLPELAKRDGDGLRLTPIHSPAPGREMVLACRKSSVRKEVIGLLAQTISAAANDALEKA